MRGASPVFRGTSRLARGSVVGGACLVSTAALHSAAGGGVGWLGLLLGAVVALSLGVAVADRRRSPMVLAAVLLGGQVILHLLMSLGAGHGAMSHGGVSPIAMVGGHLIACLVTATILAFADEVVHLWLAFLRSLRDGAPSLFAVPVAAGPRIDLPVRTTLTFRSIEIAAPRGPPAC